MTAKVDTRRSWVTVSIPRSGHHYLAALLEQSLAPQLEYCEFYSPDDCCRAVPCTRRSAPIVLQKHHDLELDLPADLPGVTYIVQYRSPLLAMLSDREYLAKKESEALAHDRDHFLLWLGKRAAYYVLFWKKWLQEAKPNRLRIDYEDLLRDPENRLRRLFTDLGVTCKESQLREAVALMRTARASYPEPLKQATFSPRRGTDSPFYDAELVPVFQGILEREIGQPREGRTGEGEGEHPLVHVFHADVARRQGDLAAALSHLERALAMRPKNRYLRMEQIDLLAALRRFREASDCTASVLAETPDDADLLRRHSDLQSEIAAEHLEEARAIAARLVEMRPLDAGLQCHLAAILVRLGNYGQALHHVNLATSLGSRDPHSWRFASEVFKLNLNLGEAINAARTAIMLNDQEAEFHHHLGNLFALVERYDEAVSEQQRAIALSPERPGWRWKLSVDLEKAGRQDEARAVVREGLQRFPDNAALRHQQGRLEAIAPATE